MTYIEPLVGALLVNLEAVDLVLHQERHRSEISVRANASGDFFIRVWRLWWIVQQPQGSHGVGGEALEVFRVEVQGLGEDNEHIPCQSVHFPVIAHRCLSKLVDTGKTLRPEVGTTVQLLLHKIGVVLADFFPNIEAFLEIRGGAHFENLGTDFLIASVPGVFICRE